jgi:hypothetical protein
VRYILLLLAAVAATAGVRDDSFLQEVARTFTAADGLPSNDVTAVAVVNGRVFAKTTAGIARFAQGRWSEASTKFPEPLKPGGKLPEGLPYDEVT